jgi:CBS domain-containing protein
MSEHFPFSGDAVPATSGGSKAVGQVMRPTTAIEPGAHLAAAAYLIKHFHDDALVVVTADTQEPVATITDADITRALADGRDLENTRISQVVTARQVAVQADVSAEVAARLMASHGIQSLPVVEGQRIVGIVELADLCG